jgi:pimeloyl-ACP methyl ester carboxylesterase
VLAGNSMGGGIVTNFALRYPDRVRGLVLVDPAIYGGTSSGVASALISLPGIQRWGQHIVRLILADNDRNADTIKSAWFDPAKVRPDVLSGYRRALQTPDWDISLLALVRDGMSNNLGPRLKDLNVPTLIVWGEHDTWISPTNAPKLNQDIAGSKLVMIENAGHVPHEEKPEEFNRLVIEFALLRSRYANRGRETQSPADFFSRRDFDYLTTKLSSYRTTALQFPPAPSFPTATSDQASRSQSSPCTSHHHV